jgi:A/G-specific adenine glycosylase
LCAARAADLQHEIPRPKNRQTYVQLREAAIVIRRKEQLLMRQCAHTERWAGLWDFPRFALESTGPLFACEEIKVKVHKTTGITCALGPLLKTLKHGVTRYRITLDCYEAAYVAGRARSANGDSPVRWVNRGALTDLPLSTTGRKIADLVNR